MFLYTNFQKIVSVFQNSRLNQSMTCSLGGPVDFLTPIWCVSACQSDWS